MRLLAHGSVPFVDARLEEIRGRLAALLEIAKAPTVQDTVAEAGLRHQAAAQRGTEKTAFDRSH